MRIDQLFPIAQTLVIKDGLGEPTELKFQLLGLESRAVREAAKRVHKASIGKAEADIDALEQGNADVTAACIVGWSGLDNADGPVPYSHAKAVELMLMPELTFVRAQVEEFVSERARFFRKDDQAA